MKNLNRAYLVKKIANFYFFMTVLRYFEVTFGHKEKWGPFGYPNFVIMEKNSRYKVRFFYKPEYSHYYISPGPFFFQ